MLGAGVRDAEHPAMLRAALGPCDFLMSCQKHKPTSGGVAWFPHSLTIPGFIQGRQSSFLVEIYGRVCTALSGPTGRPAQMLCLVQGVSLDVWGGTCPVTWKPLTSLPWTLSFSVWAKSCSKHFNMHLTL